MRFAVSVLVTFVALNMSAVSARKQPVEVFSEADATEKDLDSLLEVQGARQGACSNFVLWTDKNGLKCEWYAGEKWCHNGATSNKRTIADFVHNAKADGVGAHEACCECGGGDYNYYAGTSATLKHETEECWEQCSKKEGHCAFCGTGVCRKGANNLHTCVAQEKTCLALANVDRHDLLKAAKLSSAVYKEDSFKAEVHAQGMLRTAFYIADGKFGLDFGIADPLPHPDPANRDPWVVFAGSESTEDWKQNFNAFFTAATYPTAVPGVQVHQGFENQWSSARVDVKAKFAKLHAAGVKRVYFAGHSLGGAVATVAAAEMQSLFPGVLIELVTFGAPQCGNVAFGKNINELMSSRITRVINSGDPVPCLTQIVGVADNIAGELAWNEGSLQWSSPREEHCNKDFLDGASSITDHLMGDTYIPLIANKCN
jgi:hypothetical protein